MAQDWRNHGVRIVSSNQLDLNTPQTPGMTRAASINRAMAGANKLWAGAVEIHPNAKTAPHHHGELESVIYIVSGRARMRWAEKLEFFAEAGPGDFIFVPPFAAPGNQRRRERTALLCGRAQRSRTGCGQFRYSKRRVSRGSFMDRLAARKILIACLPRLSSDIRCHENDRKHDDQAGYSGVRAGAGA
jgi:uncharacterized RmlC-like cupin family protein